MTTTTCPIHDWCIRDHGPGDNSPGDHESTPALLPVSVGVIHTVLHSRDNATPTLYVGIPEAGLPAHDVDALIDHLAVQKQTMRDAELAVAR